MAQAALDQDKSLKRPRKDESVEAGNAQKKKRQRGLRPGVTVMDAMSRWEKQYPKEELSFAGILEIVRFVRKVDLRITDLEAPLEYDKPWTCVVPEYLKLMRQHHLDVKYSRVPLPKCLYDDDAKWKVLAETPPPLRLVITNVGTMQTKGKTIVYVVEADVYQTKKGGAHNVKKDKDYPSAQNPDGEYSQD